MKRLLTLSSRYCTQSAIDYVGYAAGQTDEFQGTGVWKGIKVKRDKLEDNISMDTEKTTVSSGKATDGKPVEGKNPTPSK
jgi:hypothetical protein